MADRIGSVVKKMGARTLLTFITIHHLELKSIDVEDAAIGNEGTHR